MVAYAAMYIMQVAAQRWKCAVGSVTAAVRASCDSIAMQVTHETQAALCDSKELSKQLWGKVGTGRRNGASKIAQALAR